jgi:hypothetical protein
MSKNLESNIIETQSYCFYFTGENFTSLVRDFWNSNLVKTAISYCTDSGIPAEVAVKICTGEYKCIGDTRDGDHTLEITDDENPEGIYFTLESQVENIEKKFIKTSQNLFKLIRKHEMFAGVDDTLKVPGEASMVGAVYRKNESKNNRKIIEDLKKKQKKELENLEILYPLVGKKISDLPVTELGIEWSDVEFDHYQIYDVTQRRNIKTEQNVNIKAEEKGVKITDDYDQGDDESNEQYIKRMTKLAKKMNPIEDIKTTKSKNGWISPDGKFYNVELQPFPMHINAASDYKYLGIVPDNIYNESEWLDKNVWMKFTSNEFYMNGKLTQSQIDLLMDYMTSRNIKTIPWSGHDASFNKVIEENECLAKIRGKNN